MAVIRELNKEVELNFKVYNHDVTHPNEWISPETKARIDEQSWVQRYKYESDLIYNICKENNLQTVLEYGSGPGVLGDMVVNKLPKTSWTNLDKIGAKNEHEKRNFKGKVIVKNLMNQLNKENLENNYDLFVANDFLEHIANPSNIVSGSYELATEKSMFFVSVPNWRMGHEFIYRGLFDYDNFIYFMYVHGWEILNVYASPLTTPDSPKLTSEESMPDELTRSWNWYFLAKKRV
jgi:2-polyprenyl-3-methyl-5-hydroxy-6-metoxy-1,4-benzoquinol methylase